MHSLLGLCLLLWFFGIIQEAQRNGKQICINTLRLEYDSSLKTNSSSDIPNALLKDYDQSGDTTLGVSGLLELFWHAKLQDIVNGQVAALESRLNSSLPSFLVLICLFGSQMYTDPSP